MKSTRPSNEHRNTCGLSFFLYGARGTTLLSVCPSLLFLHTVLRLTFHLCMRFFFFVADLLAGDPVSIVLRLTSPHSPWPSVCFINVERGRFLLLGPHELDCSHSVEIEGCLCSEWSGQWCTLVSDFIACLSVSTVSFSISLPVHCLHTHHTYCGGTWHGTWEDF